MTNKIKYIATITLSITMLSSCGIYKKYETPQDGSALVAEYAKVQEEAIDTTAFGNLRWDEVFTDPVLVDLINQALENNVNLQNAKLNVDIAQAQLKGAKLSYLPSVALAPGGNYSSFAGSDFIGTYQIPLAVSWEIDIFGKLLNNKRSAEVTVEQTKAYNQAVRSQIIGGVANCYYAIATIQRQIELYKETARLWAESIEVMKNLKLGIACDHAGFALKQTVIAWLQEQGVQVTDYGCPSTDSCDYPDFAHPMAASVEDGTNDFGIAICSTGNGITMTCNHHQGIRAALCWDEPLAALARQHNNANILGLPANYISAEKALELVKIFLSTEFEGGRHERRVNKIACK